MTSDEIPVLRESRRRDYFLPLGVLASCLILLMGLLLYLNYADQLRVKERDDLLSLVQVRRDEIATLLKERVGDALILSQNPAVLQILQTRPGTAERIAEVERFDRLRDRLLDAYGYRRVQVFDRNGRPQTTSNWPQTETEAQTVRSVLATGRYAFLNQIAEGETIGECVSHIKIVYPVVVDPDASSQAVGAVLLDFGSERDLASFLVPKGSPY
ncbi:MAG TPA: hypothetical protein VGA68_10530, partial [Woeseiaceae bacterium]